MRVRAAMKGQRPAKPTNQQLARSFELDEYVQETDIGLESSLCNCCMIVYNLIWRTR